MSPFFIGALSGAVTGTTVALLVIIPWRWRSFSLIENLRTQFDAANTYIGILENKLYSVRRAIGAREGEPTERAIERFKKVPEIDNIFDIKAREK